MNKKSLVAVLIMIVFSLFFLTCGGDKDNKAIQTAAKYLPDKSDRTDLKRISEIRTFFGDALWEYIDGGAEVYHSYNFIEVATADYKDNKVEMVADIYRFNTPTDTYGLYSVLRPDDAQIINLGVEGFAAPASVNYVKGEYLIRLTGYEESMESDLALINFAEELNEIIPGKTSRPEQFGIFPEENRISSTDKYYADQFLGQKFLTHVFSQDYSVEGDTVALYWMQDSTGSKFMEWRTYTGDIDRFKAAPADLQYDENYSFILQDNFYGDILAGLRKGKLVGMVNFSGKSESFFKNWLNSVQ